MRAYKAEIKLTPEQITQLRRTIGVCRFIYNLYISKAKEIYRKENRFLTANEFSVWLNNEYIPDNPEKSWIKEVSSKAVKQSVRNGETAFKRFFNGKSCFPKYKKRSDQDVKMYFVKNDAKMIIQCERHRIKIPTLGFVRLKEFGYLPTDKIIRSGTVSEKAGKFYVTVLVDESSVQNNPKLKDEGIGIDLGLINLAVVSNGQIFGNKNKEEEIKKLEKKLRREQRGLSRKYENKKKRGENLLTTRSANIDNNVLRVQKLHHKISRKRQEYVRQVVSEVVKTKPNHITIEDLNVSGMMKNKHLSKAIASQNFYYFRLWLVYMCGLMGIEVRIADRFYPSSKLCSQCGSIKSDLKLKDRLYMCDCGNKIDRDLQASINLERCQKYKVV